MKQLFYLTLLLALMISACTSKKTDSINYAAIGFGNFIDRNKAEEYLKNYDLIYQPDGVIKFNDSLTKAVWFDREIFHYIDSMLFKTQDGKDIDGVRIYLSAYSQNGTAPGQKYPNQMSLILVATKGKSTVPQNHKDDWDFFKVPPPFGINHGELCPTVCN